MTPIQPGKSLEWFTALTDVPGVVWREPDGVVVDSRLSDARPVPDERGYSPLGVAWVDSAGKPIADDYRTYMSPSELLLQPLWEALDSEGDTVYAVRRRDPDEAMRTALHALAVPGTRFDYHQALTSLSNVEGANGALVEFALQADVQLVVGDPSAAVVSPLTDRSDSKWALLQASEPVLRLVSLYVAEGFLIDAAAAERLLDELPEASRPRQVYWKRPDDIASALQEVGA